MAAESGGGAITSFLTEDRVFPPPAGFAEQRTSPAWSSTSSSGTEPRTTPRASGPRWPGSSRGIALDRGPRLEDPPCEVVRRGPAQRELQLRRPPLPRPGQEQGRADLRGRAGRPPGPHLRRPPPRGEHVRRGVEVARRGVGGHRGDLHADDPRSRHRHARLRPDRRGAHRRLRRLQRRGARRPDPGLLGQGADHRRRRLSPRQGRPAQAKRRPRRRPVPDDQGCGRLHAGPGKRSP